MNYSNMQSQLAFNRQVLRDYYDMKAMFKNARKGNVDEVESANLSKVISSYTRTIAKLEKLQKVLKADMQRELAFQRANRSMQAMCEVSLAAVREIYE